MPDSDPRADHQSERMDLCPGVPGQHTAVLQKATFLQWPQAAAHPGLPHLARSKRCLILQRIQHLFQDCKIPFVSFAFDGKFEKMEHGDLDGVLQEMNSHVKRINYKKANLISCYPDYFKTGNEPVGVQIGSL